MRGASATIQGNEKTQGCSLVQHHQGSDQARDGCALENDGDQENSGSGGKVEQNKGEHELPVHRNFGHEADQTVHYATEKQGWNDSKGKNVEEELG